MLPKSWRSRARLAEIALTACILLAAGAALLQMFAPDRRPAGDDIALHERRLQPLRDVLQKGQVVGYVRDVDAPGSTFFAKWHYLTQYVLAPTIVMDNLRHPLVVCDCRDGRSLRALCRREGLAIVVDLKNGVALARGTPE